MPAGPNRPATVPEAYVVTPFGYFHPSCVRQLAEGDTLLEDESAIQHADGSMGNLPACGYLHYTPSGEIAVEGTTAVVPPMIGHSWIEAGSVTTSTSYGQLTATWTVPPAPASNDGQTVYFFPGFEQDSGRTTILQPVLGWNADFAAAWGIASWNCCPGGNSIESKPLSVTSGDKINGAIQDTCAAGTPSCPTWNVVTADATVSKSTPLRSTSSAGHTFNWAFGGALEVYSVSQCADYPPNGQLSISGITLDDDNFNPISNPVWSVNNFASGLTPQCGYGVQVAPNKVTLDYANFVTLYSFEGTDGAVPNGGLIQGSDGSLYGTTYSGGAYDGAGAVFKITPSGALATLYSFCAQGYPCTDGGAPEAALAQASNGYLYGTTYYGGANGDGSVFRITPSGVLTTLHSFFCPGGGSSCTDGSSPEAALVQASSGYLYGTTFNGGEHEEGTVFSMAPGGALTILYSFCSQSGCADGINPWAAVVQASNGYLYGTTGAGGANNRGTVFRITPSGLLNTLYSFCSQSGCTDGGSPSSGLVPASDGNFYGVTLGGGTYGQGTVFRITPSGTLSVLYSFSGSDGVNPDAGLIQASDGNLYGTTILGGANGAGTMFKITLNGTLTTLYTFCSLNGCADGAYPRGGALIQASDGNLYGTTAAGGTRDDGTVFRLSLGLTPPNPR